MENTYSFKELDLISRMHLFEGVTFCGNGARLMPQLVTFNESAHFVYTSQRVKFFSRVADEALRNGTSHSKYHSDNQRR